MSTYSAWPFLSDPRYPFASAVWAVLIHGLIALLVVAPIIWRSAHRMRYALLTFVGGSALDLDHFVAAGTLSLHAIETLPGRPVTHSLLAVLILGGLTFLLTRRIVAAWAVFAVNLSHVLFDAAGGGERVFYPLAHPDGLPWLVCPIGALALLGVSAAVAGVASRSSARVDHEPAGAMPFA